MPQAAAEMASVARAACAGRLFDDRGGREEARLPVQRLPQPLPAGRQVHARQRGLPPEASAEGKKVPPCQELPDEARYKGPIDDESVLVLDDQLLLGVQGAPGPGRRDPEGVLRADRVPR